MAEAHADFLIRKMQELGIDPQVFAECLEGNFDDSLTARGPVPKISGGDIGHLKRRLRDYQFTLPQGWSPDKGVRPNICLEAADAIEWLESKLLVALLHRPPPPPS